MPPRWRRDRRQGRHREGRVDAATAVGALRSTTSPPGSPRCNEAGRVRKIGAVGEWPRSSRAVEWPPNRRLHQYRAIGAVGKPGGPRQAFRQLREASPKILGHRHVGGHENVPLRPAAVQRLPPPHLQGSSKPEPASRSSPAPRSATAHARVALEPLGESGSPRRQEKRVPPHRRRQTGVRGTADKQNVVIQLQGCQEDFDTGRQQEQGGGRRQGPQRQ